MKAPRLVLMELREYRAASGSTYFAGFLGKTRVVMLRDERAEITGKEVARWNVLLEEPQPRDARGGQGGGKAGQRRTATAGQAEQACPRQRSGSDRPAPSRGAETHPPGSRR